MKRNIFLSVVVSGIILLLASCNDGSKGISGNRIQDSREYSAEDSLIKKTAGDTILPTGERGIRPEQTAGKNAAADLQNFRKRTVSKYFTGMEADSLSVGRAELRVPRGSMDHARILSITPLRKGELPHLPAGMVNVTADRSNPTISASRKNRHAARCQPAVQ